MATQERLLCSIKGIGEKTAALLLAELGDIRRFDSARQFAAFLGITPQHFQSGTSVRKPSSISKQGNSMVRGALYFPAIVVQRWNLPCRALAERLKAKGKAKMLIVIAVMRKLSHQIFGVLKSQRPFDPFYDDKLPLPS